MMRARATTSTFVVINYSYMVNYIKCNYSFTDITHITY